ncbi:MAG: ABC transporter permease [Planctomycetes bacterium]|nr:ABC transporter permease [Planctomycetota bacterium]
MLLQLIRKEILEHLMSLRFAIACILCFAVILCSLFVRCQDYSLVMEDYYQVRGALETEKKNLRRPEDVIYQGLNIPHRPNPLSIFVSGVSRNEASSYRITTYKPPQVENAQTEDPLKAIYPSMDLITFVGIIMSLMAVIFGYDSICGEKERGTLRLMLSYSVPRDLVLLGKWLGGYLTLIIPFLLAIISGATIVLIQPEISLTPSEWLRLIGLFLLSLLYIAAIYSAAIWVSALTRKSSTSILAMVTLWMIVVLAVPNLSPHLAQALKPIQKVKSAEEERQRATEREWATYVDTPIREYDILHANEPNDWSTREKRQYHVVECHKNGNIARLRKLEQIDQSYGAQFEAQTEISRWLARISPFSSFAMSAAELTDNGALRKKQFIKQLNDFQLELSNYGHDEWLALIQYRLGHNGDQPPAWTEQKVNPIPTFTYTPCAASIYVKTILVDAGLLAGMTLLFFLLSYVSFLRYDVR